HQVDSDSCSYFLPEHYLPDEECGAYELSLLHRHRAGLDPGRAEEMFITHAMSLTEYGTQYISALLVSYPTLAPQSLLLVIVRRTLLPKASQLIWTD
ncbi:unnamed protein product, partial [Nesidiocoris tenuis]